MLEGDIPLVLPDNAIAIRGGEDVSATRFLMAIDKHAIEFAERPDKDLHPGFCLSLNCVPDRTASEVAEFAFLPNPLISFLTVRDIRNAGFEIVPSNDSKNRWRRSGHCDVYIADGCHVKPTPEQLGDLSRAFRGSLANPRKRNRTL